MAKPKNELKGQPFIGNTHICRSSCGDGYVRLRRVQRICGMCFYRYGPDKDDRMSWLILPNELPDCRIVAPAGQQTPHQLFGFRDDEHLPHVLGGKQVGNYCPYFLFFLTD